jgi:hypothetical protein
MYTRHRHLGAHLPDPIEHQDTAIGDGKFFSKLLLTMEPDIKP